MVLGQMKINLFWRQKLRSKTIMWKTGRKNSWKKKHQVVCVKLTYVYHFCCSFDEFIWGNFYFAVSNLTNSFFFGYVRESFFWGHLNQPLLFWCLHTWIKLTSNAGYKFLHFYFCIRAGMLIQPVYFLEILPIFIYSQNAGSLVQQQS